MLGKLQCFGSILPTPGPATHQLIKSRSGKIIYDCLHFQGVTKMQFQKRFKYFEKIIFENC